MNTFIRDVAVNVLANLIAAAIVYLLGIFVGLFPSTAEAVKLAIVVIFGASFIVLVIASTLESKLHPREPAYRKSLTVVTIVGVILGVSMAAAFLIVPKLGVLVRVMGVIAGISTAFVYPMLTSAKIAKNETRAIKNPSLEGKNDELRSKEFD